MRQEIRDRLKARLDRALAEDKVAGAVLMVAEGGKVVLSETVGQADREDGRAMTADTVLRLASITKPIVTTVALRLVEEGKLSLSDPVTRYLPGFRPQLPDGTTPEITLRHLLTHSAGLSYRFFENEDGPYSRADVSDGLDQPGLPMAENLERIAAAGLFYPPGQGWRYSVAMDVLGAALEVASGETLPELVQTRVSDVLGLSSLAFDVGPEVALARPYYNTPQGTVAMEDGVRPPLWGDAGVTFAPSRARDGASFPSGGAGMVGAPAEIVLFLDALRDGGGGMISRETAALMRAPQVSDHEILTGPGWAFGYGGGVLTDPAAAGSPLPVGAFRWGGVYGHTWFIDPAAERTVLLATNTAYEGMTGELAADLPGLIYQ